MKKAYYLLGVAIFFTLAYALTTFTPIESAIPPTPAFKTITANNTSVISDSYNDNLVFQSNGTINIVGYDGAAAGSDWYGADWIYRYPVTLDHTKVSGDQTDFPILFSVTDSLFADNAQSDGDDFVFTLSDGITVLSHEIDNYNSTSGKLQAWVKIPDLSSTIDTELYVYFGNPATSTQENINDVWTNGYAGVWHMDSTLQDSTSNNLTWTNSGTTSATGNIGDARYFDGVNDFIYHSFSSAMNPIPFSFSFWRTTTGSYQSFLSDYTSNTRGHANWWCQYNAYGTPNTNPYIYAPTGCGANVLQTWQSAQSGTTTKLYNQVNGTLGTKDYTSQTLQARTSGNFEVGRINTNYYKGYVDELRISNVIRAESWTDTRYTIESNPSAFVSLGTVDALLPDSITIDVNPASSGALGGVFSGSCSANQTMTGISTSGGLLCNTLSSIGYSNATSLNDLLDVINTSPSDGDILQFDSASGNYTNVPFPSSGGITNGTNLGTGAEVLKDYNATNMNFKTLVNGTNISITSDANEITINSDACTGATYGAFPIEDGIRIPATSPALSGSLTKYFDVAGMMTNMTKVTALISIVHADMYDLTIQLYDPDGNSSILYDGSSAGTEMHDVTFDDNAGIEIDYTDPVGFAGYYRPSGNTMVSAFNGDDPNGTWSLVVTDNTGNPGSTGWLYGQNNTAAPSSSPAEAEVPWDGFQATQVHIWATCP